MNTIARFTALCMTLLLPSWGFSQDLQSGEKEVSTKMQFVKIQSHAICVITKTDSGDIKSVKLSYRSDDQEIVNDYQAQGYTATKLPPSEKCTMRTSRNTIPTITLSATQNIEDVLEESEVEHKQISLILFNQEEYLYQLNQSLKKAIDEAFSEEGQS